MQRTRRSRQSVPSTPWMRRAGGVRIEVLRARDEEAAGARDQGPVVPVARSRDGGRWGIGVLAESLHESGTTEVI